MVIALFSTCETEVDITTDYERIPVVYGLLDQSADTQFILINRSFLGSGNAIEMAMLEDSMLYENVDAKIRWGNGDDDFVQLQEITRNDKDIDGIFFAPSQKMYYALSSDIEFNTNFTYTLEATADGDAITAETSLSSALGNGNGAINQPIADPNFDIQLVNTYIPGGSIYNGNFRVAWNVSLNDVQNAVKQKVDIRFNYREVYLDGSFADKSITFPFFQTDVDLPGEEIEEGRSGEWFYSNIASRIDSDVPDLRYREIGTFDFILTVAEETLTTYLNIGDNQVSEVGQTRPSFSNINNGEGIGIFSSRDIYTRVKLLYDQGSEGDLEEMVRGIYTGEHCFCDPTNISSEFGCNNDLNHCQ